MFDELKRQLIDITGYDDVSLQPNRYLSFFVLFYETMSNIFRWHTYNLLCKIREQKEFCFTPSKGARWKIPKIESMSPYEKTFYSLTFIISAIYSF